MASAMIERAELPVQRKSTLNGRSAMATFTRPAEHSMPAWTLQIIGCDVSVQAFHGRPLQVCRQRPARTMPTLPGSNFQ